MKRRILFGVFLSLLVGVQVFWFSKAYDANTSQFDHQVSVALFNVADTISDQVSVEKVSSNYFYVTANSPACSQTIDTLIQKEFTARNLELDYEIGVYNAKDDSLVHAKFVAATTSFEEPNNKQQLDGVSKNFAVLFPERKNYIASQVELWVLIPLFLFLASSPYWVKAMKLQPSLVSASNGNQISLGNSRLDFHNQHLQVNNESFQLTYKENKILKLFFENPNQVVEREVFLEQVWQRDGFFTARSMDVFISKIRKYLSNDESIKIVNLRSIGYRLHVGASKKK